MRAVLRKLGIAVATTMAIIGTVALPSVADARGGFGGHFGGAHFAGAHFGGAHFGGAHFGGAHFGGAHFAGRGYWGGYRGHWGGWRGYGWGLGSALAAGYYGGYYGPYAYDYGYYGPYAYDYGYGAYAYAPDCYIRRHWVINRFGHRVLRRTWVCD